MIRTKVDALKDLIHKLKPSREISNTVDTVIECIDIVAEETDSLVGDVAGKQDTLTAGNGISISEDSEIAVNEQITDQIDANAQAIEGLEQSKQDVMSATAPIEILDGTNINLKDWTRVESTDWSSLVSNYVFTKDVLLVLKLGREQVYTLFYPKGITVPNEYGVVNHLEQRSSNFEFDLLFFNNFYNAFTIQAVPISYYSCMLGGSNSNDSFMFNFPYAYNVGNLEKCGTGNSSANVYVRT